MKTAVPQRLTFSNGFTLTEMAVVLVIVALLIAGLVIPFSAQQDIRARQETERMLSDIREALLGYAAANGRLPCPATAASNGLEDPVGGGVCTSAHGGFLPSGTLGIAPINSNGFAVDTWNQPIRYAVSNSNASAFTTANGMRAATITVLAPDLQVCPGQVASPVSNAGAANATCNGTALSTTAVAVIYSLGRNGGTGGAGTDESHNPNPNSGVAADRAFISHLETPSSAPQGEFDDVVIWLSPNILYSRLIAAGQLP
ncbi:MAG: type II secretion system protein [Betaproteobacteria bacterium]|nr:type II secretion system protein [Betaproteobacteria bacterium]